MKKTPLNFLNSNEMESSLALALESPLMNDVFYMWIVNCQYVYEDPFGIYNNSLTYVAKSFNNPNLYTVGTIINGENHTIEKGFSKQELVELFPSLFKLTGQFISIANV